MQVDTRLLCHEQHSERTEDSPQGKRYKDGCQSSQHDGACVVPATLGAEMGRRVEARRSKSAQVHSEIPYEPEQEGEKKEKGKRRKSGERSRCVTSSFDVVYQVFLNHVSVTEPELSSTWCCLRDQEGVGVWLLLPLLGLNKHCVVLCGIQLSKWVPKRLMQLLRRVG